MKKIVCTLPNASSPINGIEFEPCDDGLVSVEAVEDGVAERFAAITGYKLIEVEADDKKDAAKTQDTKQSRGRRGKKGEADEGTEPKDPAGADAQAGEPGEGGETGEQTSGSEATGEENGGD